MKSTQNLVVHIIDDLDFSVSKTNSESGDIMDDLDFSESETKLYFVSKIYFFT